MVVVMVVVVVVVVVIVVGHMKQRMHERITILIY